MNTITQQVQDVMIKELNYYELELSHFIPIPFSSNSALLKQSICDSIQDSFLKGDPDIYQFLVQIRPKRKEAPWVQANRPDAIYLPDGKMNAHFLMKNAELLFQAKEYGLAKKIYLVLLKLHENPSEVFLKLAQCEEEEGQLDEAAHFYEKAISYSSSIEFYRRLFSLRIRQGQYQAAAEIIERSLLLKALSSAEKFDLCQWAGECWVKAENLAQAKEKYLQAIQIQPSSSTIECRLGEVYLKLKEWGHAKQHFQAAIALFPQNSQALSGLGICFFQGGDKKEAHHFFSQSLDLNLQQPSALFYLIQCAYEIRSYTVAEKKLTQYIEGAPPHPHLSYSLAGLKFHLGLFEEAFQLLQTVLEKNPEHSPSKKLFEKIQQISLSENSFLSDHLKIKKRGPLWK